VTVTLRLFAAAREAAGRGHDEFDPSSAPTVDALLDAATTRYGSVFGDVLARSRVWVNGDEPSDGRATRLADGDEVAVLPPVSGGIA
jgi:MoaD family protein